MLRSPVKPYIYKLPFIGAFYETITFRGFLEPQNDTNEGHDMRCWPAESFFFFDSTSLSSVSCIISSFIWRKMTGYPPRYFPSLLFKQPTRFRLSLGKKTSTQNPPFLSYTKKSARVLLSSVKKYSRWTNSFPNFFIKKSYTSRSTAFARELIL